MPEWISVEDVLPQAKESVLAFDEEYGFVVAAVDSDGIWSLDYPIYYYHELPNIVYWTPLPEAPEGYYKDA